MPRDAARPSPLFDSQITPAQVTGFRRDNRFADLMGQTAWQALPPVIRDRFARKAGPGESVVYAGQVTHLKTTRLGKFLINAALLIGAPLPTSKDLGAASVVTVTEDACGGGQTWSRLYARRAGSPRLSIPLSGLAVRRGLKNISVVASACA